MTTLILCIDRDNDIGEKALVESPVIGKEANIQAAVSLGLADPEDSDSNSIFGAVKLYNRFRSQGKDVEVVTIAGDIHVGVDSDTRIMEQVGKVVRQLKADKAILVTDGAEDESLLGLLQTKIDVIGLERITVKQERKIEGLYYYIQKAIEDEKMRRVVLPLAFILMFYGISVFFALERMMWALIVFFIGVYLLMKTYHLEGEVNKLVSNVTEQINEGKLSWVFSTFTVILLLVGFFDSLDDLTGSAYYDKHGSVGFDITFIIYILIILNSLVWWIILSLLVREAGKLFDTAILAKEDETYKEMDFWYYFNFPLFIISTGLFLAAGLTIVQYIADSSSLSFSFQNTMSMIIIGLALFIGGRYLYALGGEKEKKKRHFPYIKRRDKIVGWRH